MTPAVVEALADEADLAGVLEVEGESFTNPWTRAMYEWELQNRTVCHVYIVRTPEHHVAGFCAFWLVVDEVHINNVAVRPHLRGRGLGTLLLEHVFQQARALGASRATLEVRASNLDAQRLYARLGFLQTGLRRGYYSNPVEDAVVLWRIDQG